MDGADDCGEGCEGGEGGAEELHFDGGLEFGVGVVWCLEDLNGKINEIVCKRAWLALKAK